MRRTLSKQYRRQAEQWCYDLLYASFPEEVVATTSKDELWKLAFPETHFMEVCQKPWDLDEDGDPKTYRRMRLFRNSPRWIYKKIKENPSITQEELKKVV